MKMDYRLDPPDEDDPYDPNDDDGFDPDSMNDQKADRDYDYMLEDRD